MAKFWKTVKCLKGSTSSSLPQQMNSDIGLITEKKDVIETTLKELLNLFTMILGLMLIWETC
jgi:hypothetical protein